MNQMACKNEKNNRENTKDTITLRVTREPMREFIFNDNFADAMVLLLERSFTSSGKPIKISNGAEISISAPADPNKAEVDCKKEIRRDRRKPNGCWRKTPDNSVPQNLGWSPKQK
jgi:nucleoside-diphosphate-sugar epimerase